MDDTIVAIERQNISIRKILKYMLIIQLTISYLKRNIPLFSYNARNVIFRLLYYQLGINEFKSREI